MTIITKYLTREISKYMGIVLGMVVGIYVAVDFFEKIDNFIEAGLPISKAIIFFIFKTPLIIAQIFPVCVLLSVLIVMGLMNKNNELVALKTGGVSIWQILKPIISIGFLFSLFLFFFCEVIVPLTVGKSNQIWLREVRKRSAVISREKNIWLKDTRQITHIKYYDKKKKAILGLTIYYFDEDFKLAKRTDAKKGVFKGEKWLLYDVVTQYPDKNGNNDDIRYDDKRTEPLKLLPENLETVIKKSEEMSFKELLEYIGKIEAEGYDATAYRVDLHAKVSSPFICVILCIIGLGIAVRRNMKERLPVAIAYGIGIAFLFWVFHSFCLSLGYGEMLPPVIAAWTANFIFSCFAVFNLLNTE